MKALLGREHYCCGMHILLVESSTHPSMDGSLPLCVLPPVFAGGGGVYAPFYNFSGGLGGVRAPPNFGMIKLHLVSRAWPFGASVPGWPVTGWGSCMG